MKHLNRKNAVVTGSSLGIGKAVAMKLAAEGANVVVNSSGSGPAGPGTNRAALSAVVDEIRARGGNAVASCGSVADYGYASQLIDCCIEEFGGIDILINCAGVSEGNGVSILDMAPETWQHSIGVHLTGTFNCCKHAAVFMARNGGGSIVNTGSHAFLGIYGGVGYPAAKGGTVSLTYAMAQDLREFNINCNVVCPGAKTRLSTGASYEAFIRQLNQKGRLGDERVAGSLNPAPPEYVASVYAYLVSDYAHGVSGRVFGASGGYLSVFAGPQEKILLQRNFADGPPWEIDDLAAALSNDGQAIELQVGPTG